MEYDYTTADGATLDLQRLTAAELVQIMQDYGSEAVTEEDIEVLIADGVPCNPDGTFSIVDFTAWFIKNTNQD